MPLIVFFWHFTDYRPTLAPTSEPTTSPTSPPTGWVQKWIVHNDTVLPRKDKNVAVAYYNNSIYILYVLFVICVLDQILRVYMYIGICVDQWRKGLSISMDGI